MPFDFQNDECLQADCAPGGQLCFDFDAVPVPVPVPMPVAAPVQPAPGVPVRGARQQANYHAGISAEGAVARWYVDRGARVLENRWRGPGGEIDLILAEGDRVVFVEVKKSKTHAQAVQRVTSRQMARILASAEAYLDGCPNGSLTDVRVDVALVDACGAIDVVPNAGMAA